MPVNTDNVKKLAKSSPYALLVVLAISSLVVGSASVDACSAVACGGWRTIFGIAWGFISFFICAGMVALQFLRPDMGDGAHPFLAPFFFVVWLVAAALLTSSSGLFPFAGNGYFGVWISVLVSFYYWSLWAPYLSGMSSMPSMHGLSLLVIFSCVLWATAAEGCGVRGSCSGLWGFAIFCGVFVTIIAGAQIALLVFMPDIAQKYALYVGLVMWVTMVFGAGFLTNEKGLFPLIGNGYLATWGCFWVALYYTIIHSPFGDIIEDSGFQGDNRSMSPGFESGPSEFESRVGMSEA